MCADANAGCPISSIAPSAVVAFLNSTKFANSPDDQSETLRKLADNGASGVGSESTQKSPPKRRTFHAPSPSGNSARNCSIVSASATGLSCRHRSMRGNRVAMPLLWRLLRAMPSNPSSNTMVGRTLRTGPKFSSGGLADQRVDLAHLLVREAGIGLGERHQGAALVFGRPAPDGERVVAVDARAPPVTTLRIDEHGVDAHRIELPFPPEIGAAATSPDAVFRGLGLQHDALGAEAARLLAQRLKRSPVRTAQRGAETQRDRPAHRAGASPRVPYDLLQQAPALRLRTTPDVLRRHVRGCRRR